MGTEWPNGLWIPHATTLIWYPTRQPLVTKIQVKPYMCNVPVIALVHISGGTIKRIIIALASGALILGSIGLAGPAAAAPVAPTKNFNVSVAAAKAKAPKIVNGKLTTTRTKKPNASVQKVKLPVLQNSTAKNRKAFAKLAQEAVKAELKTFNSIRKGDCGNNTAEFEITPMDKGIYKGRYASVSLSSYMYMCGASAHNGVRSFTLDLKTGKKVGIGTFVAQDDITTKVAVATNFHAAKNTCIDDLAPRAPKNSQGYIPRPTAWSLSTKGIKFHYEKYSIGAGACGAPSVLLPWSEVATVKAMKGTVKNRVYVNGLRYDKKTKYYYGTVITTSVQGSKVTVFESSVVGDGACFHGVRSGKTATVGYNWGQDAKIKLKLKDTGANPKFNVATFGKGWREANAADLKVLKGAFGSTKYSAHVVCGA